MTANDNRATFAKDLAALIRMAPSILPDSRLLIDAVDGLVARLTLETRSPIGVWSTGQSFESLRKQWETISLWNRATGPHFERRTDLKRQEEE